MFSITWKTAGYIEGWDPAEGGARSDYTVRLKTGRSAVIDLKGCLDGANTTLFERPDNADEFVIWSLCTNVAADPRRNVWSGLHTRLSTEIISRGRPVDGLIVWDMVCGAAGRPCLKLMSAPTRDRIALGPFLAPPPCYLLCLRLFLAWLSPKRSRSRWPRLSS